MDDRTSKTIKSIEYIIIKKAHNGEKITNTQSIESNLKPSETTELISAGNMYTLAEIEIKSIDVTFSDNTKQHLSGGKRFDWSEYN